MLGRRKVSASHAQAAEVVHCGSKMAGVAAGDLFESLDGTYTEIDGFGGPAASARLREVRQRDRNIGVPTMEASGVGNIEGAPEALLCRRVCPLLIVHGCEHI